MTRAGGFTWMAFLAMTFAIVGLVGVFATYAAPVPLERAMSRETALDEALVLARTPGSDPAALQALRDRLGDSADAVLTGPGTIEQRVARERLHMRERFRTEAEGLARQLRLMILLVTLTACVFGCFVVGSLAARRASA